MGKRLRGRKREGDEGNEVRLWKNGRKAERETECQKEGSGRRGNSSRTRRRRRERSNGGGQDETRRPRRRTSDGGVSRTKRNGGGERKKRRRERERRQSWVQKKKKTERTRTRKGGDGRRTEDPAGDNSPLRQILRTSLRMGLQSGLAVLRVGKQARVIERSAQGVLGVREDGGETRREDGSRS